MTLTQLEYIIALNKFRHFHKAAEACHVTQPTLSAQVQKLEQNLGILIFDRSKSPLLPTIEGERVLSKAKQIVKLSSDLKAMDFASSELSGQFRLGIIPTLATYLIPMFSKKFVLMYPRVELIIEELKTEEIIDQLEKDEIDGALLVTPLDRPLINERILYHEELFLFCDKNHALLNEAAVDPSKLDLGDLWVLEKGHCFRDQTLNLCKIGDIKEKPSTLNYQSGSFETLIKMVESFGGFTLLPEMALNSLNKRQRQQLPKIKGSPPYREVSFVHSRLFQKEAIINALVEVVESVIPEKIKQTRRTKRIIPIS